MWGYGQEESFEKGGKMVAVSDSSRAVIDTNGLDIPASSFFG